MRRIVAQTFVTLDGVMQAPGGPEEDPSGGFAHGGWSVTYWDEVMPKAMDDLLARPFELLLGRRTYEIMAAHWPHASPEEGADTFNDARKYVVTSTLERADWKNSVIVRPGDGGRDLAGAIGRLKEQDGPELQVVGSSALIQGLLAHDLLDGVVAWIFPVVLGRGKRLFGDGTLPRGLRLVDHQVSTTGVIMATYERAGEVPIGSFAFEEPTADERERRRREAGA